ncbi:MAG: universal stress protein [Sulfolobaceae archaeon]|nr:universal stress protein [Sulfolobaceae archaeon]
MISKILIAYDGSEPSKKALNLGIELAKQMKAKLLILHVVNTCIESWGIPLNDAINTLKTVGDAKVKEALEIAKSQGVEAEGIVIEGEPSNKIVEVANIQGVDLIVMGNRGLSRFKRIFLGSVSQGVIEQSKIPVVVVK